MARNNQDLMNNEQTKAERAWHIAKAVSKIAYIHENELQEGHSSADIEEVFIGIEQLLKKNEQKWQKSQSQILETQAVEALAQIFKGGNVNGNRGSMG